MRMTRQGAGKVMWILVLLVLLLATASLVVYGFSAGLFEADNIIGGQQTMADRDTCESRVMEFCGRDGNEGEDWTERYPECEEYEGEIADTNICGEEEEVEDGATPEDEEDPDDTDPDPDPDPDDEEDEADEDHPDAEDTRGHFINIEFNHNFGPDNVREHLMYDDGDDLRRSDQNNEIMPVDPDFDVRDDVCSITLREVNTGQSSDYGVYVFDYDENTAPAIFEVDGSIDRDYDHSETDHQTFARYSTTDIWETLSGDGLYGHGYTEPMVDELVREYYFDHDGDDFDFEYRQEGEIICGEYEGEMQWVQCREFRDGSTVTIPQSGETLTCDADLDLDGDDPDINAPPAGEWGTWG